MTGGTEPAGGRVLRQMSREPRIGTRPRHATQPVNCGASFRTGLRAPSNECRRHRSRARPLALCAAPRTESRRSRSVCVSPTHLWPSLHRVRLDAPDRLGKSRMQVAAVHQDVGRAVALDRDRPEIERLPALAGAPEAGFLAGRNHLRALERLLKTERMQDARSIGPDLDARADLLELASIARRPRPRRPGARARAPAARPPIPPPMTTILSADAIWYSVLSNPHSTLAPEALHDCGPSRRFIGNERRETPAALRSSASKPSCAHAWPSIWQSANSR